MVHFYDDKKVEAVLDAELEISKPVPPSEDNIQYLVPVINSHGLLVRNLILSNYLNIWLVISVVKPTD